MARRAAPGKRVIGVSRFSEAGLADALEADGIETIALDLLNRDEVARLPNAENVVFMAGQKFGASDAAARTWAMNVHVPALVAEACRAARIVAFSTGCVYPFVAVASGGATEATPAEPPPGDYAASCVGRERMFEYFSAPARHARLPHPAQLCDRHALRRAVRRRHQGAGWPAGRPRHGACERDLAGRCLRDRAPRAPPRHDTDPSPERHRARDAFDPLAGRGIRRTARPPARNSPARRPRRSGSPIRRRRWNDSARAWWGSRP